MALSSGVVLSCVCVDSYSRLRRIIVSADNNFDDPSCVGRAYRLQLYGVCRSLLRIPHPYTAYAVLEPTVTFCTEAFGVANRHSLWSSYPYVAAALCLSTVAYSKGDDDNGSRSSFRP